jgi:hypothetical protein
LVGYNCDMKKASLAAVLIFILIQVMAVFSGCGGDTPVGMEEELVRYTIENILIPREQGTDFIVEWRRRSTGPGDVDPKQLAQGFWKWEGGTLTEINAEEYYQLAAVWEDEDPNRWVYSQHSITVVELDESELEAQVEINSLYNPLSGSGIRYWLRKEEGEWKKVSENTEWVS